MTNSKNVKPTTSTRLVSSDYNLVSPSLFDERCISTYKQITFWNSGRKSAEGKPKQKDWYNHYTRAILRAQEILELRKMTKETEKTGIILTEEQIQKRIKEAQWSKMKEVKIPKGYKSKCKKITISSMKYKKPRIPNKPDIDNFSNRYLDKTDSTYNKNGMDKNYMKAIKPVSPKNTEEMDYLEKEILKLEQKREQLIELQKRELEKQEQEKAVSIAKESTGNIEMEQMKTHMSLIQQQLNLIVDQLTKDKKPKKRNLRFRD